MSGREPKAMQDLRHRLATGDLPAVLLLVGESATTTRQALDVILDFVLPARDRLMCLTTLNGRDSSPGEWSMKVRTRPMLGARRVVVVDEADQWLAGSGSDGDTEGDPPGAGRKKVRNHEMDAVLGLLHTKNTAGLLILVARQVDARLKLLRELQTLGALLDLSPFDDQSSPRSFVFSLFRERGVQVEDEAVTFLVDAIGDSVDALTLEVEKLSDHAGDSRRVTLDDAQAMVRRLRGHKYWDLADAAVRRDARQSLVILSRMFDSLVDSKTKVNAAGLPLVLLAVLAGRFEQLAAVHQASDQRLEELSLSLQSGPKPVNLWLLRKLRGEAQEFTPSELENILSMMNEVDGRLKSTSHSPRILLESLIVTICTRAPRWYKRQSGAL